MENESEELLKRYQGIFEKLKMPVFPGNEQLKIEYESIPEKMNAEILFKKYGVGNSPRVNRPLERMEAYELLLEILRSLDLDRF